jgi:DNA-binding PadR family transcriptional regulator
MTTTRGIAYYMTRSIVARTMTGAMRLSAEALLILVSLADGPKHGYAIQQDIHVVSGRRLGPGTLYGAIARLEGAGLIEALAERGARRPYRLTPAGTKHLRTELASLKDLIQAGTRRLAAR